MSKLQKIIAGICAVCVVFFGFVVLRIAAAPNDSSVKLAKIPEDKKLTTEAYKDAYPLEYESYGCLVPRDAAGNARELQGIQVLYPV